MKTTTKFKIPFTNKVLVMDDTLAYPLVIIALPVFTCLAFVAVFGIKGALISALILVCYTIWKEKMISINDDNNQK